MSILHILLLFGLNNTQAKFARSAFDIPCDLIELSVEACEKSTYTNQSFVRPENNLITYEGVVLKGKVQIVTPALCHPKQKMKKELYKNKSWENMTFFLKDGSCGVKIQKLLVTRQFCDTPGAMMISECFIRHLEVKHHFQFSIRP